MRLKQLRELKDLGQKEIAFALNIDQSQYSRYERGANEIPIHYLIQISRTYNVSIDWLCGEPQRPYPKYF